MLTKPILIVEDFVITALDLKNTLKKFGFSNSVIINEGQKAIDFIECETPLVVLLDINLADEVSGLEVARCLNQKKIPFIFISAFSDKKNFKLIEELNPVGVIEKPFDCEVLRNLLPEY